MVSRISHVHFAAGTIDRERSWVVERAMRVSFCAPRRQHLEILVAPDDSRAALINDVKRLARCDVDLARPVKSGVGSFPIGNEIAFGRELLDSMVCRFCDVNV